MIGYIGNIVSTTYRIAFLLQSILTILMNTYCSKIGGMTTFGHIKLRLCKATAASLEPIFENMASIADGVTILTNLLTVSSLRRASSGIFECQQGFLYLSLKGEFFKQYISVKFVLILFVTF